MTTTVQAAQPAQASRLRKVLDQPVIGFVPWIALSVLEGPHRLVLAAAIACALALLTCVLGAATGVRPKLLDVTGIVFFAALAVVAALADAGLSRWLGVWAGEVSNVAIALITGLSILARKPFTLQYARETTDRQYWKSALFLRINYVITAVWAAAFLVTAVAGWIGDGPLHQPDNIWTNWIIQIGVLILAIKFTGWYPDYATAGDHPAAQHTTQHRKRHFADLLRPLAAFLVPVGIVVMIVASPVWWVGAVIVVAGVVVTRHLHRLSRGATTRTGEAGS